MPKTNQKIHNIQVFRGIAVLLVLFFHVMLMEKKWGSGDRILSDWLNFGQSGVDMFFIISGFVMTTISRGQFQHPPATGRFVYNRLVRIYPPYWFYSTALLAVLIVKPSLVNPSIGGQVNVIASFLLIPQNTLPLLMVGWSLVYEMYFYLLFAVFLLLPEKHFFKLLVIWLLIITLAIVLGPQTFIGRLVSPVTLLTSALSIEFIGGCLIAKLIFSGFYRMRKACLLMGLLALAISVFLFCFHYKMSFTNHFHRVVFFGLPYMLIIYGVVALEIADGKRFFSGLKPVGDASYSIYLSHTIVINGLGWVWAYGFNGTWHIIWISIMTVLSIVTGFIGYRAIEVPALSWFKSVSPFEGKRLATETK